MMVGGPGRVFIAVACVFDEIFLCELKPLRNALP
jgi:hypothetical protein